jgi:hypothetical protein
MNSKSFTIKGHSYTTNSIPARKAVGIAYRLVGVLADGMSSISKLYELDSDGKLILEILSHTIRDDMAINEATFDNIYTGNLGELLEALKVVVEFNFADFLQGSGIGSLSAATRADSKDKEKVEIA